MKETLKTEVLIVGAGPTGLMAANQLLRFGVDFIIIDHKSRPTRESRAITVTARSLEIYQQMGIDSEALSGGKRVASFSLYSEGKRKADVMIGEIGKGLSEFSYMLSFEQSKNEELLVKQLTEAGKVIHWKHEFISLKQMEDGVESIARHENEKVCILSRYLIACDGASSPVRTQLNFSFRGGTYRNKFFVADVHLDWKEVYDKLIIAPGDENFCAFLPMYGERNYRIIGTLPKSYFDREDITFRDIDEAVVNTLGIGVTFESVNWFSVYKLHHRGVENFRAGNVFLAGDSAHIHSPAGGQGMNTGLQDAYNLCWKLAFVLRKQASPKLLDTYNEERLPFAKWLLSFTDRGFKMMTSDNWFIRFLRKNILFNLAKGVISAGWPQPLMFRILSQTGYSHKGRSLSCSVSRQKLNFRAGDRLPYFESDNIYPLFRNPSFHLLHIGESALSENACSKINESFPFPVCIVENTLDRKWIELGVKMELFVLVRPDNYIGLICDELNNGLIQLYMKRF
ncbi:FAD-dependent monooxygenase [Marinoscillum sp. MHG1-6]|uniref:FAD-dependent monooxygenase n=1 Tax=Marinoscillum sp. MHG1-6 TaxID=2959627 RepID=UPI0021575B09|nr:FAD-dependent monooxygenase [Marinoscillum sp. MHG1-6]